MLKLRYIGDDILRQPAEEVTVFDDNLAVLANNMINLMHESDGIGLAAPQVGISKRLLVVDISPMDKDSKPSAFINPVILESSGESTLEEGCLSIPGVTENVTRPDRIILKYQTPSGEEKSESFDSWMARVLQHEIDHLNGILFIDHLSPLKQKLVLNSLTI
jgi:peptide deformylase